MKQLFNKVNGDLISWSNGSTELLVDHTENNQPFTIFIKISFGSEQYKNYYALFDTGARWSVIPASVVTANSDTFFPLDIEQIIYTRFGKCTGILHQCDMTILVDEGEDIPFQATVLVLPDEEWPHILVVGFTSVLDKIRWACDPVWENQGRLYFGLGGG